MTPEQDMQRVCQSVTKNSGHWPYTHDAEVFIGFRPGQEAFTRASGARIRVQVSYDIVICARRSAAATDMEQLRYALYDALEAAGWKLDGPPGPEAYSREQGLFMWPVTAVKSFAIGRDGLPYAMEVTEDE